MFNSLPKKGVGIKEREAWIIRCAERPIRKNLLILSPDELRNYAFYSWLALSPGQINTSSLIPQSLNGKYSEGVRL